MEKPSLVPLVPFHLAIPVRNLEPCSVFDTEVLGCAVGRRSDDWIVLNLVASRLGLPDSIRLGAIWGAPYG